MSKAAEQVAGSFALLMVKKTIAESRWLLIAVILNQA